MSSRNGRHRGTRPPLERAIIGGLMMSVDASFAKVTLSQAQLLWVQVTNDVQAALAALTA
ncbi:MAG: hypothetical protein ABJA98_33545 [Acidobacteriota bacterium]